MPHLIWSDFSIQIVNFQSHFPQMFQDYHKLGEHQIPPQIWKRLIHFPSIYLQMISQSLFYVQVFVQQFNPEPHQFQRQKTKIIQLYEKKKLPNNLPKFQIIKISFQPQDYQVNYNLLQIIMKLYVLILCFIQLNAYEYWITQYSAFTSNNIIDNEGWSVQGNNGLTSFCNGVSLFGGFNVFGSGASASKLINLPPHYKLRVSFEFWKIDSWDKEYAYFILDDNVLTEFWNWDTSDVKCGNPDNVELWKDDIKNYVFEFLHYEPTLAIIFTTNLDEGPYYESWGFRMFTVQALLCSPGCLMCYDDTPNECWYYGLVEMNWFDSFNFDGWTLDNQQFLGKSSCVSIWVIGGIGQITGSKQLLKQYTSLTPHYKIILQVQLWKFDFWNNNQFQIEIDGQISLQAIFNQIEVVQLCGSSGGGERLINIRLVKTHTSDSVQIKMKSNLVSSNGFWGLRAFRLFVIKCYQTCLICSGPNKNECSVCITGFILHNSECVDLKWILGLKQYFQPQDFQTQSGWTITNVFNNKSPFQICANTNLLGGFSLFGKDASVALNFDLPNHTKIRIKLEFWKFDTWDHEWFKVFANGIQVFQVQFGYNGVQVICGSNYKEAYKKKLDFEFDHIQSTVDLIMTTSLNELADNESWGIRDFQLLYGVPKECSNSIIDSISMPSFIGTNYIQSTLYSSDQTLQNKIEIPGLGISLQSNFDQTITVDSAIEKLTISISWKCFLNDQTFSISILQSSYTDYKTGTAVCKQKRSNVVQSVLTLERTIIQQSQIRLLATSTSLYIFQIVEGQTIKLYEMLIN
ncbi:unnamed protein product [Paramecium pentaurelia]|uniref:Uncharacterized protein n=1 Tax=Paramecium pentaurelia TaxID=43138 RepID=A0A8S1XXI4_9CILI|nr:unnamed protein product [Paramecium pentaurelia]